MIYKETFYETKEFSYSKNKNMAIFGVFPFLRTENFQNLIPNLGCKSSRNL
ncbi:hypothetical protein LEP1GSC038_0045 [Leptospira weilii str. 2006001855]|uniref:Uncharacterized protein n=1 Tax=Leptospira weilii str. 2006001855 TaxID=996804 RepID=M6FEJ8_9LEPT|nr:hypothetical protein LEP1GSC038_0045 [Leptospira weilii str. 2006001855]